MQVVEPPKLLDRGLVVVDTEVDEDVGQRRVAAVPLDDEKRRGLLAATVATGGLGRREARQQSLGQRAFCRFERLRQRVDRLARDENVALGGVPWADSAACPVVAGCAGERGAAAGGIDHSELTLVSAFVGLGQPLDDLLGRQTLTQEREAVRAVARIRIGLRRDGAHLRLGPGDDRPDGEELRLHGNAPLPRIEVAGHDRIRRDQA